MRDDETDNPGWNVSSESEERKPVRQGYPERKRAHTYRPGNLARSRSTTTFRSASVLI